MAKTRAAIATPPTTGQKFDSLALALAGCFEHNMEDIPEALQRRIEQEFFPNLWDHLSAEQRRRAAQELDYQNDPATEQERRYWWDFFVRMGELEKQIAHWEEVETPTASDMVLQETRLKELRQELHRMELQKRQGRGDFYPEPTYRETRSNAPPPNDFIAYPKAMKILRKKWQATPEELAVWIFLGPESDGIAAYLNANELSPPPIFSYAYSVGSEDYLSPLMMCWFRRDDIDHFTPAERYITGKQLLGRWGKLQDIQAEAFIIAKIAESRLVDLHPIAGGTRVTFAEQENFPPLEAGLFAMSHIEQIETEDLDLAVAQPNSHPQAAANTGGRPQSPLMEAIERLYLYFRVTGNLTVIQPNSVRAFLKELKSHANDDVQGGEPEILKLRTYLAERIKEVKIPRGGSKCSVLTHDRHEEKKIVIGSSYDQDRISTILSDLRKKYPLPH
jgi:hypothetical protein